MIHCDNHLLEKPNISYDSSIRHISGDTNFDVNLFYSLPENTSANSFPEKQKDETFAEAPAKEIPRIISTCTPLKNQYDSDPEVSSDENNNKAIVQQTQSVSSGDEFSDCEEQEQNFPSPKAQLQDSETKHLQHVTELLKSLRKSKSYFENFVSTKKIEEYKENLKVGNKIEQVYKLCPKIVNSKVTKTDQVLAREQRRARHFKNSLNIQAHNKHRNPDFNFYSQIASQIYAMKTNNLNFTKVSSYALCTGKQQGLLKDQIKLQNSFPNENPLFSTRDNLKMTRCQSKNCIVPALPFAQYCDECIMNEKMQKAYIKPGMHSVFLKNSKSNKHYNKKITRNQMQMQIQQLEKKLNSVKMSRGENQKVQTASVSFQTDSLALPIAKEPEPLVEAAENEYFLPGTSEFSAKQSSRLNCFSPVSDMTSEAAVSIQQSTSTKDFDTLSRYSYLNDEESNSSFKRPDSAFSFPIQNPETYSNSSAVSIPIFKSTNMLKIKKLTTLSPGQKKSDAEKSKQVAKIQFGERQPMTASQQLKNGNSINQQEIVELEPGLADWALKEGNLRLSGKKLLAKDGRSSPKPVKKPTNPYKEKEKVSFEKIGQKPAKIAKTTIRLEESSSFLKHIDSQKKKKVKTVRKKKAIDPPGLNGCKLKPKWRNYISF